MTKQVVGSARVSALEGVLIIAGIMLCLLLGSFAGNALLYLGLPNLAGTIAFWAFGVALAAYVFFRYAVSYCYTADGVKFTVERAYGRRSRFVAQILKREIAFMGRESEARAKYANMTVTRACKRSCALPVQALVYKRAGEYGMLLLQLNDDMLAQLNPKNKDAEAHENVHG